MAQRGFTLIEVLAVMAIVGIVVAVVTVKLGVSDSQRVTMAAERLALTLDAARDEAILTGRTVAWSSDGAAYQFWLATDQGWLALTGNDALAAVTLAEPVRVSRIAVNGSAVPLGERLPFDPAGVNPVVSIELAAGPERRSVAVDALGRSSVAP
ncbi:GspH/FimT family pseudopilin [Chitinibacteraceae bacterium HSL-7]